MRSRTTPLAFLLILFAPACSEFSVPEPDFETIVSECGLSRHKAVSVGDSGGSLAVTAFSGDPLSPSLRQPEQLDCLLEGIQTPDHVTRSMDTTRALDGRQDASWDFLAPEGDAAWDGQVSAEWSYHPDSGMNLIVTKNQE